MFVKSWFKKKLDLDSQIKFDFEFEGMESSVMILIQNHGDMSGSLSIKSHFSPVTSLS